MEVMCLYLVYLTEIVLYLIWTPSGIRGAVLSPQLRDREVPESCTSITVNKTPDLYKVSSKHVTNSEEGNVMYGICRR